MAMFIEQYFMDEIINEKIIEIIAKWMGSTCQEASEYVLQKILMNLHKIHWMVNGIVTVHMYIGKRVYVRSS